MMNDTTSNIVEEVQYIPHMDKFEQLDLFTKIQNSVFGGMSIQLGLCSGVNRTMDAVEYHRSSELNICGTDIIVYLGKLEDIDENMTYDSDKLECFLIPKGTAVEFYSTTLHYTPCSTNNRCFKVAVALPDGTGEPIHNDTCIREDQFLVGQNKWVIQL